VRALLARLRLPTVVDADGLNALAGEPESLGRAAGPLVLTPHPGEYARLLGVPRSEMLADRIRLVRETAARFRLTLVLKMARTLVVDSHGTLAVVPTGNPGMATGGTGDVLTGLIAGLIAQGIGPAESARAGAYLHGLAGDLAAGRLGQEAMLAGDLLKSLPEAIRLVKGSGAAGEVADQAIRRSGNWANRQLGNWASGQLDTSEMRIPGCPIAELPSCLGGGRQAVGSMLRRRSSRSLA
jgi:NAD(P)H-hydrate epimerase